MRKEGFSTVTLTRLHSMWKLKPWLDEVTVAKVEIMGGGYKEVLLKQIPKENYPKSLVENVSVLGFAHAGE